MSSGCKQELRESLGEEWRWGVRRGFETLEGEREDRRGS